MTLATLAPVSGNQTGIWIVLALVAVFGIVAVLWQHERVSDRHDATLAAHEQQLATLGYQMPKLLEHLGIEIPEPVSDDSPEAMEQADDATDEFPAVSDDTIPDGIPLAVQSALIDRRPSPVPRRSAEWVEQALEGFDFSGRDR